MRKILTVASGCLAATLYGGNLLAEPYKYADLSNLYVGVDALQTNYATKDNYGSNVFGKNPAALNAFVGYKLPYNLFVEAGYEQSKSKERTVRLEEGDYLLGTIIDPGDWVITSSKTKIQFPYLGAGFNYFMPNFPKTSFSVLVGCSVIKIRAEYKVISEQAVPNPTPEYIETTRRTFSKNKLSPLFRVGVNHKISNKFGVRLHYTFHKLNNFKIKTEQSAISDAEMRLKNRDTFGVGVIYTF